jgi:Fe-S cluster assembly scaffold protein SufB
VFTKKENATLPQQIEVLDWHKKHGKKQTLTAEHFAPEYPNIRIRQPLISSWVKEEAKWREQREQTNHQNDRTAKRARQTEHPQVSEMMYLWVSKAMGDNILLIGDVLRQKWNQFADLVGIPDDERLKLSNGWLGRFKDRNGLRQMKRHGEAALADAETVEKERKQVQELIKKYGYKLRNIFNMDETGNFFGYATSS